MALLSILVASFLLATIRLPCSSVFKVALTSPTMSPASIKRAVSPFKATFCKSLLASPLTASFTSPLAATPKPVLLLEATASSASGFTNLIVPLVPVNVSKEVLPPVKARVASESSTLDFSPLLIIPPSVVVVPPKIFKVCSL